MQYRDKIAAFLGSKKCFWLIMVLFVVESSWIALTLNYPAIFDEGWHVGIINLYAHQLGPFISHQSPIASNSD